MRKIEIVGLFLIGVIGLSFLSNPSQAAEKRSKDGTPQTKQIEPVKPNPPLVRPPSTPKIIPPIDMTLEQKGHQLILRLSRRAYAEILIGTQLVQKCQIDKWCDITTSVKRAKNGRLKIICTDADKNTYVKVFPVAQYAHLYKPVTKRPQATSQNPAAEKFRPIVPGEPVPLYVDLGIRITNPSLGETVLLGEPLVVVYSFSRSVGAKSTFFRLSCDGEELASMQRTEIAEHPSGIEQGVIGTSRRTRRFEWNLPEGSPGGENCIIEANHGDARGLSSLFSISSTARFESLLRVELIEPGEAVTWERGIAQTVKWRVDTGGAAYGDVGPWRFGIRRQGQPGYTYFRIPSSDLTIRPAGPGRYEYVWTWRVPQKGLIDGNYLARIEEVPTTGSSREPPIDNSAHTFQIRSRRPHDLAVAAVYLDNHNNLIAEISDYEGPFVGTVELLAEKGYDAGLSPARPDGFEANSSWTRRAAIDVMQGDNVSVNLGPADLPLIDLTQPCGLKYRVTIDVANEVNESNENNNSTLRSVYYRNDVGIIKVGEDVDGNWRELTPPRDSIDLYFYNVSHAELFRDGLPGVPSLVTVIIKNCSRHPVGGGINIVQTFNPDSPLYRSQFTVVSESLSLNSGESRQMGSGELYVADDSMITVSFTGEIAGWLPNGNPFTIHVNRRD